MSVCVVWVSLLNHGPRCMLAGLNSERLCCVSIVGAYNRHAYDAAAEGLRATHHIGGGAGEDQPITPSPSRSPSAGDGSGAGAPVSGGGGGGSGVEERRQLTEFFRRPWIHDSAQQQGADGLAMETVGVASTSTAGTAACHALMPLTSRAEPNAMANLLQFGCASLWCVYIDACCA